MFKISHMTHAFRDGYRSGTASLDNTNGVTYLTRVRNARVVWDRRYEIACWRVGYLTALLTGGCWKGR